MALRINDLEGFEVDQIQHDVAVSIIWGDNKVLLCHYQTPGYQQV